MEITSYVLGMLTVMGVAFAILLIVGMVKINKQRETIEYLNKTIDVVHNNSDQWIRSLEEQMCRNFDDMRRDYSSYVDSRIDKLQSKKEATK